MFLDGKMHIDLHNLGNGETSTSHYVTEDKT